MRNKIFNFFYVPEGQITLIGDASWLKYLPNIKNGKSKNDHHVDA